MTGFMTLLSQGKKTKQKNPNVKPCRLARLPLTHPSTTSTCSLSDQLERGFTVRLVVCVREKDMLCLSYITHRPGTCVCVCVCVYVCVCVPAWQSQITFREHSHHKKETYSIQTYRLSKDDLMIRIRFKCSSVGH